MSARDPSEAERLALGALALQEELLDADEEIWAQVQAWGQTIEFERSPVGRGAIIS